MNDIFNPTPQNPVSVQSDAFSPKRFSNYDGTEIGPLMEDGSFYTSQGQSGLGKDTSGSGVLGFIGDLTGTLANVATSIWGSSDKYLASQYATLYNQEKKTTNILIGVVAVLVVLAFVFLVIKKK